MGRYAQLSMPSGGGETYNFPTLLSTHPPSISHMSHLTPIDISTIPDLARIVEEVEATNKPRKLRRDNKPVALLTPVAPTGKTSRPKAKTTADYEAFKKAAGSWKDVDAAKLIADIHRWRQEGSRPHTLALLII